MFSRTGFLFLIVLLPMLGAISSVYHGRALQKYVSSTKRIEDMAGLARFQQLVAQQMRGALLQLALLTTPLALYFIGILTGRLRLSDIAFVIIPAVVLLAIGYLFKKVEAEACRIQAVNEDLDEQRLAVIKRWKTSALPDW
jgi:hypothetical protein